LVGIFKVAIEDRTIGRPHRANGTARVHQAYSRWPWPANTCFKLLGRGRKILKDHRIERIGEKAGMGGYSIPSPDGRYLIAPNLTTKTIDLLPTADGAPRVLCKNPSAGIPAFSWSTDGKSFVWNDESRLRIDSVVDGTSRTLVEAGPDKTFGPGGLMGGTPNTAFSPDGTKIAYVLQAADGGPGRRSELWIVSDGRISQEGCRRRPAIRCWARSSGIPREDDIRPGPGRGGLGPDVRALGHGELPAAEKKK
jgi:hypothetical protein